MFFEINFKSLIIIFILILKYIEYNILKSVINFDEITWHFRLRTSSLCFPTLKSFKSRKFRPCINNTILDKCWLYICL